MSFFSFHRIISAAPAAPVIARWAATLSGSAQGLSQADTRHESCPHTSRYIGVPMLVLLKGLLSVAAVVGAVGVNWSFRNLPSSPQSSPPPPRTTQTMSTSQVFSNLLNERGSIREYAETPVPDELIAELLRLTQRAPTAFNTQPYVAILARSTEDRARLAPAMLATNQAKVTGAPLVVVFAADLEPSKNVPRLQELMRAGGAPEGMVNFLPMYLQSFSGEGSETGSTAWAYKQTAIAAATFLYAAAANGLATCPMEGFDQEAIKKALGLTDRYSVPIVISVGYAKEGVSSRVSGRMPPTEMFFEGTLGGSTATLFETTE